jgi:hypothetical protein
MRNLSLFAVIAGSIFVVAGCGPVGPAPMPDRLSDESQKRIDESWERALQPVDKLERQALLDAIVFTQAYQVGVDRLSFRSEKTFSGGTVVMEIHFDRAKPGEDRFVVRVLDKTGAELRHLVYNRGEVETTAKDLHNPRFNRPLKPDDPPLDAEDAVKRDAIQKRIAAIEVLFPKQEPANE